MQLPELLHGQIGKGGAPGDHHQPHQGFHGGEQAQPLQRVDITDAQGGVGGHGKIEIVVEAAQMLAVDVPDLQNLGQNQVTECVKHDLSQVGKEGGADYEQDAGAWRQVELGWATANEVRRSVS